MLIKTKKLKLVLGLLATQIDEITVRSTDDGWTIRAVDPSHTSMIDVTLPKGEFVGYQRTEDFAISLKNVMKAVANAGEDCAITVDDGLFTVESDHLVSRFPLLGAAETDPKLPNIETDAHAVTEAGNLLRVSKASFGTSDAYRLSIADGVLTVSAESETKNGVTLYLNKEQCPEIDGTAKAMFAIELLDRFVKAVPQDALIDIKLGDDMPLIVDMDDAALRVRYLLAPRIETEG